MVTQDEADRTTAQMTELWLTGQSLVAHAKNQVFMELQQEECNTIFCVHFSQGHAGDTGNMWKKVVKLDQK